VGDGGGGVSGRVCHLVGDGLGCFSRASGGFCRRASLLDSLFGRE
jgi:hypothetical protein